MLRVLIALAAAAGCRRTATSCDEIAPGADVDAGIARCTAAYERDHDVRAGVVVAVAEARRHNDAAVLRWADRLGDEPAAAVVWRRAAAVHDRRGARTQMLAAREHALVLWDAAGKPGEAAYEAHLMMDAYWSASELLPALAAARRGRTLAMRSDDREMQLATFGDLFTVFDEIGDHADAVALFDQARDSLESDDKRRFYARFYEGLLRFREGRLELARIAYQQALALAAAAGDPTTERAARYNLVEVDVGLGELDAASAELARAVAAIPADGPEYLNSARAFFAGLVARARHDPAAAEAAARSALARNPIADWRWQLEDLLGGALEDLGQLDEASAAFGRAIDTIERMRRDVATDALQLALRDRKRAPYEAAFDLAARRGRVDAALAIAERMWSRGFVDAFSAAAPEPSSGDAAAARIAAVTRLAPALAASPVLSPGARGAAREVLAFVEARGALWRYHARGDGQQLERLALTAREATRLVADLRAHPDDTATAAHLGAALLPGAAATATGAPLAIVADGALASLPFALLQVGGHRLIERRPLAYVPSVAAAAPPAAGPVPAGPAIVLGAPEGAGQTVRLPAARAEAIAVATALGVAPHLGANATSTELRAAAHAPVLHVAAHGGVATSGAYLELADRRVTAADVVEWHLAPRLAVLATCASGARPGGTIWGAMAAAFLAAGSRSVLATLWSVDDASATRLIAAFYANGGARDPVAALAAAQRGEAAAGRPASAWAAFVVLGAT